MSKKKMKDIKLLKIILNVMAGNHNVNLDITQITKVDIEHTFYYINIY